MSVNSNYLEELIALAGSNTRIEMSVTGQGVNVELRSYSNPSGVGGDRVVTKSTQFWIDKNEQDKVGRLKEFLKLVQ